MIVSRVIKRTKKNIPRARDVFASRALRHLIVAVVMVAVIVSVVVVVMVVVMVDRGHASGRSVVYSLYWNDSSCK